MINKKKIHALYDFLCCTFSPFFCKNLKLALISLNFYFINEGPVVICANILYGRIHLSPSLHHNALTPTRCPFNYNLTPKQ